ncbi:MAG: glycosyltransferase family 39 protein [Myxococcota bacterium]|nr:glycosyltransferase family 39 protein [Myxococcota bacterium]
MGSVPAATWLPRIGAIAVLLAGALLLRLQGIGDQGFWIDEHASVLMAGDGSSPSIARIRSDVHPPFYFGLLHYWMRAFGDSATAIRLLSTVASIATVGFLYRLGHLLYGARTAWMAGLVAATSLLQIYYAQEARSYAWLMLFTVLSTDSLVRWRLTTRTRHAWLYGLWTVALLYTHYFSLLFIASQAMYVVYACWVARGSGDDRRRFTGWLAAVVLAAILFLPWSGIFLEQWSGVQRSFWIPAPTSLAWLEAPLSFLSWWGPWSGESRVPVAAIGLAFAGLFASIWFLGRFPWPQPPRPTSSPEGGMTRRESTVLLVLWLAVPIGLGLQLSLFGIDVFSFRNSTVSACAALLLGAAVASQLGSPWARNLVLAALLAPSVAQMPRYYTEPHKDQWCEAAHFVESRFQPETDAFVFDAPFIRYPFLACSTLEGIATVPSAVPTDPGHPRIWLIRGYGGKDSQSAERIRSRGYTTAERWQGVRVEVDLFDRRPRTSE